MQPRSRATFLALVGAGCAVGAARFAAAEGTKLRMAAPYSDAFAEPYYAAQAGSFAKAGFDFEVSSMANAGALAAALAGGSIDLGTGDLVSGVNAINSGLPVLLVAGGALYASRQDNNPYILAVAKDSPIHGPRDMVGATIGVPTLVGLTTAGLRTWLPLNGVELSSVKIVEIPQPSAVAALNRGTINVAMLGEPFITPAKAELRDVGHPMDAIAKTFMLTVWYASKAWVEADRDRARRAVSAIYDTARWANTHHDDTFGILVRDGKLDADKLRGMIRAQYATTLTPALVQPVLTIAAQAKIFTTPVDAAAIITRL